MSSPTENKPAPKAKESGKKATTADKIASPAPTAATAKISPASASASTDKLISSPSDSPKRSKSPTKPKGPVANTASGDGAEKKSGHARKGSGRGGRRGSQSGSSTKKDASSGTSSPTTSNAAPSEGLSNLNHLISELKDSSINNGASSPSHARTKSGGHRSTPSGSGNTPSISIAQAPSFPTSSGSSTSTLNPNAGGFQPGTLVPISDMMDEGLITPTASGFDLMTGLPRTPGLGGNFNFPPVAQPSNYAQQQQLQHLQAQQQAQAQQFQLQHLAYQPLSPTSDANEMIAEQLAIQQQLESLRIQQASLLTRFTDMQQAQAAGLPSTSATEQARQAQQAGHRRIQSHQVGGMMGSFGQGVGGFGQSGFGSGIMLGTGSASTGSSKGHGRRHSVNVLNKSPSTSSSVSISSTQGTSGSAALPMGMSPFGAPMISHSSISGPGSIDAGGSGLRGSFQFPNAGGARNAGVEDYAQGNMGGGNGPNSGAFGHGRRGSSISSMSGWGNNVNSVNHQANLAEAQSHLQQLGAYRASAGHSRIPSFGMSSLANTGLPGPGQLSMAGYGGGITPSNNNGGGQPRKSLFAPYLPQASIPPLVAAGKVVIGILRVNKRNRSDAYVATDGLESDIYICGSKDRNRALEGDLVAIELLDVNEVWGTKKDKEEKKRKKEETTSYDPRATRDIRKQDKKKDDVEVEGQGLLLFEEEEVNDDQKPQYAGHVVAVVERAPGQLFSGMLGVLRPSSAATLQKQDAERRDREGGDARGHHTPQQVPKIIWFRPTDKRVPLIAIPTEQAPHDFINRPDKYSDRLFVACIKRWPISSLHPFGTLVEELGLIGDIETETSALLKDCNFSAEDFSESVSKCLPPMPFTIPERELSPEVRRDFRQNRVFTIDPVTAKDLDDALHVVKNDDGTYEVGVHIADVTYYVKPNSSLDREARKRATTVYLVQRAVPMLPPTLSEELCSLTAGEDKLTFSTVFTMSEEGNVLSAWFGKTVINSAVKLAYSDAQEVIDGSPLPEGKVVDQDLRAGIEGDILMLANLARKLRAKRFDSGALRIDNAKVGFGLDEDGLPIDCSAFERKEANELIEEFMLLANLSVAGKIAAGLPEQALLRRHEPPIDRRLDGFIERMRKLNIPVDGTSAGSLMKSFNLVTDSDERVTLQHLSTKSMQRAKYFCTGTLDIAKFHHYALNLPLYTHFTSPIRRYADIMVHRQLEAVLAGSSAETRFGLDTEAVSKVAQTCNIKKDAARLAQEQSAHLFLCVLIADLTSRYGPVVRPATVIGVLDQAFDVLVPEFGVEKRCRVDTLPTENHVYDKQDNTLKIYWKKGVDALSWLADSQNDEHLQRVRQQAEHHAQLAEKRAESSKAADDEQEEGQVVEKDAGTSKVAFSKTSSQHLKSQDRSPLVFTDIESTTTGHSIQTIQELSTIPVILTADMTKSPPVIKVLCINPFK